MLYLPDLTCLPRTFCTLYATSRIAIRYLYYFYCDKGMKVLLLDAVTTQVVAMVYSQSQILEKEVYLVEKMDADHEPMQHLKAVYFIRPTKENIHKLSAEIARPRFSEYHVFFSSICPNELLQQLAAADEHEGGRWFYRKLVNEVNPKNDACWLNSNRVLANCGWHSEYRRHLYV